MDKTHVRRLLPLSGATTPRRRWMNMASYEFSTDSGNGGTVFMDSTLYRKFRSVGGTTLSMML